MREYTETAILAGGCFWPAQELCATATELSPPELATPAGRTRTRPPTIIRSRRGGRGHLDPERTSYRDILEFFFQIHRPDLGEGLLGSDYRSEIF